MDVDWNETFKMLRACYPIDIVTSEASCNIQFGYIHRPTHRNTSWDNAKVEICAHKWIDLSEVNYGVALINDCKYGYNVWDNVLDINLLRSQMYPGVDADKGHHEFSYELFIHDGDLKKVNEEAYKFNTKLLTAKACACGKNDESTKKSYSFLSVQDNNVLVETVKLAEDSSGYIMRFYESNGEHTNTSITIPGAKSLKLTNLIEEPQSTIELENSSFRLTFKPFEIHTVVVQF
jgi:alpha-mannosidase